METVKIGKMEILAEYGRILKLEIIPGLNVFWNNLSNEKTAYGWFNPGGDRVWISPESELFMPDGTAESYTVPAGADPGKCSITKRDENSVEMVNEISVNFFKYGRTLKLNMTRTIKELESDAPVGVAFAGYEQRIKLEAAESFSAELRPALWSVLQLPPGGKIIFPAGNMVRFTGNMPANNAENGIITLDVPSPDIPCKIGLPSEESKGIMAYTNFDCAQPYLVIRQFNVVPGGRYADAPLSAPHSPCAQQFYFDDGALGGFGEMEYHSQYLTPEEPVITDTSYLRAYSSTREQLENILRDAFAKVIC